MSELINVIVNGEPRSARMGSPLSEIISGEKPCGGHGKCGKCKVFASGKLSPPSEAERELLSGKELADGIRLSCCTFAEGDCEVKSLGSAASAQIVTGGKQVGFELDPTFECCGAAVDIGTTTLAARLYDAKGNLLAETSRLNPQSGFGADVISRIEAALGGNAQALADSIRVALCDILAELASSAKVDAQKIESAVITGNTVMLSLLTLEDTEPFSHAPFEAKRLFGEVIKASELDLSVLSTLHLGICRRRYRLRSAGNRTLRARCRNARRHRNERRNGSVARKPPHRLLDSRRPRL